jgi:two-component system sensor histidine kinase/response regulator
MSTEELITRLRSEITRGAGAAELTPLVDAIARTLEAQRGIEARIRSSQEAMLRLARSQSASDGRLDVAIREITECASEVLDVERSSVWTYDAHETAIQCIDLFVRKDAAHDSGVVLPAASYPGYFRALKEERSIAAHDAHTDARTSEFSQGYLTPLGIGAMLDAPIRASGRMVGVLCNEHVGGARTWTADEERFAGSIADFVALALESQKRLESEAQLRAMVSALEDRA